MSARTSSARSCRSSRLRARASSKSGITAAGRPHRPRCWKPGVRRSHSSAPDGATRSGIPRRRSSSALTPLAHGSIARTAMARSRWSRIAEVLSRGHSMMERESHEGTKKVEDHEESEPKNVGVRIPSPLSVEAERAMHEAIGCAIAVHRELGPGFLESIYRKAMCLELDARGLAYERE